MKRLFSLLLVLMLVLSLPSAAGASSLRDLLLSSRDELPDPAVQLGEGELFAEHYELVTGYFFTAYRYAAPEGTDALQAFTETYLSEAGALGFLADPFTMEGSDGYLLTREGEDMGAVLLPDFYGDVVLLVSEGLAFAGAPEGGSVTPQATAAPEGSWIRFTRNGREMSYTWAPGEICMTEQRRSTGTSTSFDITCFFERQPITLFTLRFPNYAAAGDTFRITESKLLDGVYLYTKEEGSLVFYNSPNHHQMESSRDGLTITITRMESTPEGLVAEGTFSGSFNNGSTLYENGSFRVLGME